MAVHKKTLVVSGLPIHVWSAEQATPELPVTVLFLMHGRFGSADDLEPMVGALFNQWSESGTQQKPKKGVIVVTFDQRNHGARLVDVSANYAWKGESESNDRHAIDMYSIQVGTSRDVSLLIDFLPAFLYPSGEQKVVEWGVAGISLGGHASWLALANEPRVTFGIVIIGCPDFMRLISWRAGKSDIPMQAPYLPESFVSLVLAIDPASQAYNSEGLSNPFHGKKILVLSGEADALVPWVASDPFVKALNVGDQGVKEVNVLPGVGHECTPEMVTHSGRFVWEHVLSK